MTLVGPPPTPILCERVNILVTRKEEIKEVQTGVFACLANAQERQVFFNALLGRRAGNHIPESRKGFDCMLGIVVVSKERHRNSEM